MSSHCCQLLGIVRSLATCYRVVFTAFDFIYGSMDRILNMLIVLCQLITAVITLRRRVRARRRLELMMLIQDLDTPYRASPQTWQRPRSSLWWENYVLGNFTDREWLTSFRMTRQTFERLCNMLPSLQPDPSSRRPPVPHQKRVAIAIYKLANCCEYRVVAGKFGVSITTVHRCVYAVCRAITSKLLHQYDEVTLPIPSFPG